jgi:hypothetical protein
MHYLAILLSQGSSQLELEAGVDRGKHASDLSGKDG